MLSYKVTERFIIPWFYKIILWVRAAFSTKTPETINMIIKRLLNSRQNKHVWFFQPLQTLTIEKAILEWLTQINVSLLSKWCQRSRKIFQECLPGAKDATGWQSTRLVCTRALAVSPAAITLPRRQRNVFHLWHLLRLFLCFYFTSKTYHRKSCPHLQTLLSIWNVDLQFEPWIEGSNTLLITCYNFVLAFIYKWNINVIGRYHVNETNFYLLILEALCIRCKIK